MIYKKFRIVTVLFLFLFLLLLTHNNVNDIKKEIYDHSLLVKIPTNTMRVLLNPTQINCIVKNTYYEARGEPIEGKAAVIRVVLNRVMHSEFANTPCEVIKEFHYRNGVKVCQFSWFCDSTIPAMSKQSAVYKDIEKLVIDILAKNMYNDVVSEDTVFFHAVYVNPRWAYKRIKQIGNHIFYSDQTK